MAGWLGGFRIQGQGASHAPSGTTGTIPQEPDSKPEETQGATTVADTSEASQPELESEKILKSLDAKSRAELAKRKEDAEERKPSIWAGIFMGVAAALLFAFSGPFGGILFTAATAYVWFRRDEDGDEVELMKTALEGYDAARTLEIENDRLRKEASEAKKTSEVKLEEPKEKAKPQEAPEKKDEVAAEPDVSKPTPKRKKNDIVVGNLPPKDEPETSRAATRRPAPKRPSVPSTKLSPTIPDDVLFGAAAEDKAPKAADTPRATAPAPASETARAETVKPKKDALTQADKALVQQMTELGKSLQAYGYKGFERTSESTFQVWMQPDTSLNRSNWKADNYAFRTFEVHDGQLYVVIEGKRAKNPIFWDEFNQFAHDAAITWLVHHVGGSIAEDNGVVTSIDFPAYLSVPFADTPMHQGEYHRLVVRGRLPEPWTLTRDTVGSWHLPRRGKEVIYPPAKCLELLHTNNKAHATLRKKVGPELEAREKLIDELAEQYTCASRDGLELVIRDGDGAKSTLHIVDAIRFGDTIRAQVQQAEIDLYLSAVRKKGAEIEEASGDLIKQVRQNLSRLDEQRQTLDSKISDVRGDSILTMDQYRAIEEATPEQVESIAQELGKGLSTEKKDALLHLIKLKVSVMWLREQHATLLKNISPLEVSGNSSSFSVRTLPKGFGRYVHNAPAEFRSFKTSSSSYATLDGGTWHAQETNVYKTKERPTTMRSMDELIQFVRGAYNESKKRLGYVSSPATMQQFTEYAKYLKNLETEFERPLQPMRAAIKEQVTDDGPDDMYRSPFNGLRTHTAKGLIELGLPEEDAWALGSIRTVLEAIADGSARNKDTPSLGWLREGSAKVVSRLLNRGYGPSIDALKDMVTGLGPGLMERLSQDSTGRGAWLLKKLEIDPNQ